MRNTVKVKIASLLTLTAIACQSFPGVAMAYDISERIEAFTKSQVEISNKGIETRSGQIDRLVDRGILWVENKTLNGLSTLENLTGRNEQNSKTYKKAKTNFLESVGVGLGLIEGTKDISLDLYSLIAKVPTAPERLVNFAIDYNRDSDKYHKKVTTTVNSISDAAVFVAKNPLPVSAGIYQYVKNVYTEAKKDPLEYGKLGGKITANVGFLLVGGTQIKALSSADKVEKATKASSVAKNTGTSIFSGKAFNNFLRTETASLNLGQVMNINFGQGVAGKISSSLSQLVKGKKVTVDDVKAAVLKGKSLPATKESLGVIAKMAGADLTKASKIKIIKGKKAEYMQIATIDQERRVLELNEKAFKNPTNLAVILGDSMTGFEVQLLKNSNKLDEASKTDTLGAGLIEGENFAAHFPGYKLSLDVFPLEYKLFKAEELAAWYRGL